MPATLLKRLLWAIAFAAPLAAVVQRADDQEATIRKRLEVYREQTEPLVGYYREQGRLLEVPGMGPMEEVTRALRQAIGAAQPAR